MLCVAEQLGMDLFKCEKCGRSVSETRVRVLKRTRLSLCFQYACVKCKTRNETTLSSDEVKKYTNLPQ